MKWYYCLLPVLLTSCVPVVIGGSASVGAASTEERGLDGAFNDQNIRLRVNYEWVSNPGDFEGIEVTVYNGKVLLTGHAKSKEDQHEAYRLARLAPGVRDVFDATTIGEEEGFSDLSRDGWISTKLKTALLFDENIYSQNYSIRTAEKVIYIMGVAQDQAELDHVIAHAHEITGVRHVMPLVDIKTPEAERKVVYKNIMYQ